MRRFAERGRAGATSPSSGPAGSARATRSRSSGRAPAWLIPRCCAAWMGDLDEMREALAHDDLDGESRGHFTRMLARRDSQSEA